jgi:fatty acid synthase subunit alpha
LAPQKLLDKLKTEDEYRSLVDQLNSSSASNKTCIGVDIEDIAAINISSETFVVRNFSEREQAYCQAAPFPQASFAGRWCAKEAVFKSLGVAGRQGLA